MMCINVNITSVVPTTVLDNAFSASCVNQLRSWHQHPASSLYSKCCLSRSNSSSIPTSSRQQPHRKTLQNLSRSLWLTLTRPNKQHPTIPTYFPYLPISHPKQPLRSDSNSFSTHSLRETSRSLLAFPPGSSPQWAAGATNRYRADLSESASDSARQNRKIKNPRPRSSRKQSTSCHTPCHVASHSTHFVRHRCG